MTGAPSAPARFLRDERGAYAIEFAFFGSLLFAVALILMQYAIIHLARQNLDTSLQTATRSLLTGSFQNANGRSITQAQILENMRTLMCEGRTSPAVFFKCADLKVDVQVSSSFGNGTWSASAVDSTTGTWAKGFGATYQCPSADSTAVVRAAVKLPLIAPLFIKLGLASFSDGAVLLQSASVFKVEPFQSSGTGGC